MSFVAVDLSRLPPPDLIEALDFEALRTARRDDVLARWAVLRAADPTLPALDTLDIETEPLNIAVQAESFRELLVRNRVNAAARALLLAYAEGADLDHRAALFGVARAVVAPAADGQAAVMEDDGRLRRRVQLAPEAFATTGARGAYIFHALSFSPAIEDAWAWSPRDGEVHVAVGGIAGAPVADALLVELTRHMHKDDIKPLTDVVVVRQAEIVPYDVALTAVLPRGPDPGVVRTEIEAAVRRYCGERRRIGAEVRRSGLYAAAMVRSIETVSQLAPGTDLAAADHQLLVLRDLAVAIEVV